eukprot:gene1833-16323_t
MATQRDATVAKKSFLQKDKVHAPYLTTVSGGESPLEERVSLNSDYDIESFKDNEYQNSLNSEDSSRYETVDRPFDVFGPKEHYYTVQHGNKKFDTIITQAFRANGVEPEVNKIEEKSDPALGSEYVSFPQDSLRENEIERYWDYVPINSKLELGGVHQSAGPGSERTVGSQQAAVKGVLDGKKLNIYGGIGIPVAEVNKQLQKLRDAKEANYKVKDIKSKDDAVDFKENSDILDQKVVAQKVTIEPGSKRQSPNVTVHNRSPGNNELQKLREDGVMYVNSFRKIHNAPMLKLDSHMSAEAEDWANILASRGKVERNPTTDEAENVFYRCGQNEHVVRDAVVSWYKDICEKGYNFESNLDNADSNQFTNLVWKGSSKLGLGVAKKDISIDNLNLSCFFVVARYDDNPVHHLNTHKKNVLKGKFNEKNKMYEKEILSVHNNFRKVHNAGKLKLDQDMSKESAAWAQKLADAGSLKHDPDTKDGENLYMACVPKGRKLRPWKSVVAWYVVYGKISLS